MTRVFTLFFLICCLSCNNNTEETTTRKQSSADTTLTQANSYPDAFVKILDAHGGLENWLSQKTMVYEISKDSLKEIHTIDLALRKDNIITKDFELGFDGSNVWLKDKNGTYRGNPFFYHNLMFYFFAMPFVLADKGIVYEQIPAAILAGKNYPGIKMTFNTGVGESSGDEYLLYYDSASSKMQWLAYKATFGKNKNPENYNWIKYDWKDVDGLILPSSIAWYSYENGAIGFMQNTINFENSSISRMAMPDTFYAKPEGSKIVTNQR